MLDTLRTIISDHIKYWRQIVGMGQRDLKKGYAGSAIGWAWTFANPIVRVGVYLFAFSVGLKQNRDIGEFSYFYWLLSGLIVWFYVQRVFNGGATCIKRYRFLVTKIKFPVCLIPTFTSFGAMITHFYILGAFMIIMAVGGHFPTIYWLQLPLYMLLMFLVACAWGLFAGILSTMSLDFQQLVKSITMAVFWLSGIFFTFDGMPIWVQIILNINPLAVLAKGYRDAFINGAWFWESPWIIEGIIVYILLALAATWLYKKFGKELPDVL